MSGRSPTADGKVGNDLIFSIIADHLPNLSQKILDTKTLFGTAADLYFPKFVGEARNFPTWR